MIDVVCGGFPCQDISPARGKNRKGLAGDSSSLWFAMRDVISDVRPSYIIVENSTELRNNGMSIVLGELASLGYVGFWHCIPASYVGAGHIRDRVWICAHAAEGRKKAERWPKECSQKVAANLADAYEDRLQATHEVWEWQLSTC